MAKSLENTSGKNRESIPTYQTFGLKRYWLTEFFEKNDEFWTKTSLGPRQVEAFKSWLRDAGVLERRSLRLTPLGERLKALGAESPLTWEILWVKLSQGSRLVRWFLEKVAWGETLSKKALAERLGENIAKRTRENAISALLGLFEHTPLHKIAEVERVSGKRFVHKRGIDDITLEGLLFALYSLAETRGRYQFALSDLLRFQADTPYGLFGLSREKLSSLLRAAATKAPKWLKVDLMYDLEAVYLAENVGTEAVLGELTRN